MLVAALGWLGTVGTFMAYAMLWKGSVTPESRRYAALNVAGGLMGGSACVLYGAWPSAASNFAWAALALYASIAANLRRRPDLTASETPVPTQTPYRHTPVTAVLDVVTVTNPLDAAASVTSPCHASLPARAHGTATVLT
jgi:hypothetical protein